MSYPSNEKPSGFNNMTREQLDSMSVAELLELLENINETMTEDNFDDELIEACLEAIDRKSPMPEYPSTDESLKEFEAKLHTAGGTEPELMVRRPRHRFARVRLIAAIVAVCLFSGMIAVQAAGIDVLGAIARWTDSVFGFEPDEEKVVQEAAPSSFEECMELLAPKVPEGFIMAEPVIYQDQETGYKEGVVDYYNDTDYIMLTIIETRGNNGSMYEKDDNDVEIIDIGNCRFYVFSNNGNSVTAWRYNQYECGINTSLDRDTLISILHDSYADGV